MKPSEDSEVWLELVDRNGKRTVVGAIDVNKTDTFDEIEQLAIVIGEQGKLLLIEEGIKKNRKFK